MKKHKTRINENINAATVLLIDEKGGSLGEYSCDKALQIAQEKSLDLVEVFSNSQPPVCKILDYGRYKYELDKKLRTQHKQKKRQTQKEIRMQPKISEHDLNFKVRHIDQFLSEGSKVKVTIRFRGRELAYTSQGYEILQNILNVLKNNYGIDKKASMEGNFMTMLLSPSTKSKPKPKVVDASQLSAPKENRPKNDG